MTIFRKLRPHSQRRPALSTESGCRLQTVNELPPRVHGDLIETVPHLFNLDAIAQKERKGSLLSAKVLRQRPRSELSPPAEGQIEQQLVG